MGKKGKLYKNKEGNTLYPVCSWEKNQHKLYNAYDRACNRLYDIEDGVVEGDWDKAYEEREEIARLLDVFNGQEIGGMVYATYEDSVRIKNYIVGYDCRTDELKALNGGDEYYGAD